MQALKTNLLKGAFKLVEDLDTIVEETFGSADEFEISVEGIETKVFLEVYYEAVETSDSFAHEFGTEEMNSLDLQHIRVENAYYYNEDKSTEELEFSEAETVSLSQIILNK